MSISNKKEPLRFTSSPSSCYLEVGWVTRFCIEILMKVGKRSAPGSSFCLAGR
jgi:hypothetical protein